MPDITNDAELKAVLLKEISVALNKAAFEIQNQLWIKIFSEIYMKPESDFYQRTDEFFKCVIKPEVKVDGFTVSVEIGMDSSKMSPIIDSNPMFNKHMSQTGADSWRGMTISEALLSWYDYGTDNNVMPSVQKTNYWYDIMGDRGYKDNPDYKNMEKVFDEIIYKELSKIGTVTKM